VIQMMMHASGLTRDDGFSIIEILIILAGAAIIAAIALPSMGEMMNNYNIIFAAQEIGTQLHFAKLKAVSSNEAYRVRFPTDNSYQVELSDGTLIRGTFCLPQHILPNTADTGHAVTFPGNYVLFQPNGSVPVSGNGSTGRVKLISANGLRVDVLVDSGGIIRHTPPYKGSTPPF
jgi:Tfp pilus assembly protein FimT